jgi:hypothetical protein
MERYRLNNRFYYVTVGTEKDFLQDYTQWSIQSLIKTGISTDDIYFVGRTKKDIRLIKRLVPELKNILQVNEDLDYVKWKYHGGTRKYSLFKAAALHKCFTKPKPGRCMIYFDGDVLWYKNPTPFFETKCEKTWFHHGKSLEKRAKISRKDVDIRNVKSLSRWASEPAAYLMVKYGATVLPEREVVAGFYLLHPRDHEQVLKLTYEGCKENATKFIKHEGAGDQKPMNAALAVLNVDWHGGSKFFCPEHSKYFDHFFGKKDRKQIFQRKIKKMNLFQT